MAEGPTVIQTEGGGATVAGILIAIIATVVLLFLFGVIDIGGNGSRDIDVNVDVPAIQTPADPAPSTPAPQAPASGG